MSERTGGVDINKIAEIDKINQISDVIASELKPEQIYLFGSFANGTQNEDSDYDFYIIVDDSVSDIAACVDKTDFAIFSSAIDFNRSVDLLVDRKTNFRNYCNTASLQRNVLKTGVCIYDSSKPSIYGIMS